MKHQCIDFSTPMMEALIAGRKTKTRRIIEPQPYGSKQPIIACEYGKPGDFIYVREAFGYYASEGSYFYKADGKESAPYHHAKKMPRQASRFTLEIINIRAEPLKAISEADAIAEGIEPVVAEDGRGKKIAAYRDYLEKGKGTLHPIKSYKTLWDSLHGAGSWDADPFVWVIEFKPHKRNIDKILGDCGV